MLISTVVLVINAAYSCHVLRSSVLMTVTIQNVMDM
jgi:hypothetical protein